MMAHYVAHIVLGAKNLAADKKNKLFALKRKQTITGQKKDRHLENVNSTRVN